MSVEISKADARRVRHVKRALDNLTPDVHAMFQRAWVELQTQNAKQEAAVEEARRRDERRGPVLVEPKPIIVFRRHPEPRPCKFGDQQYNKVQKQIVQEDYMRSLTSRISKMAMSRDKLQAYEDLRLELSNLVSDAIHSLLNECGEPLADQEEPLYFYCYGSLRSGYAMSDSKIDLFLNLPNITNNALDEVRRLVEKIFVDEGVGALLLPSGALKICDKPHPVVFTAIKDRLEMLAVNADPPLDCKALESLFGARCLNQDSLLGDIHFTNKRTLPLSWYTTDLLRCYRTCDIRVYRMGLFVKEWASNRNISDPKDGTLPPYGYLLMLIHYLRNVVKPPVIPNLQVNENSILNWVEDREVMYWDDRDEITAAAKARKLTANTQSIESLLCGFFAYYSGKPYHHRIDPLPSKRFWFKSDVVSIRSTADTTKERKGWNRSFLAIEDPFDLTNNVAQTVDHENGWRIRREFERAHVILNHVQDIPGIGWEWRTDSGRVGEDFLAGLEIDMEALSLIKKNNEENSAGNVSADKLSADKASADKNSAGLHAPSSNESPAAPVTSNACDNNTKKSVSTTANMHNTKPTTASILTKHSHNHDSSDRYSVAAMSSTSELIFTTPEPSVCGDDDDKPSKFSPTATAGAAAGNDNGNGNANTRRMPVLKLDPMQLRDLATIRAGGNGCMRVVKKN
ncbi:hypothetical protein AJ80_02904 [Polytolypa hystricis UAMH7299]|uniref:PAP-associated domain-containing protein n=1 Tax=Polytolypa hystricis (strain UAMH7299) TaxID=1447883 RepID=A0A2B7YPL5_POLH7|nr:hypothetical protein AJ80_02904 [Polytolypa hystricis UAMH7299]